MRVSVGAVPGPARTEVIRTWRDGSGVTWRAALPGEEERDRYDAFVRDSPRGHPLQLWSWGEVKRGDGWLPLRVVVERAGRIAAAASVVEKPVAKGHLFWLAHRGPVAAPGSPAARFLWEALSGLAAARGAMALRCDPEWPPEEGRLLRAAGFEALPPRARWYLGAMEPIRVWRIGLHGERHPVFGRFDHPTPYAVRRALRKGVVIRAGTRADLWGFHALERAASARKSFAMRSPEFFERLWNAWQQPGGGGRLFIAEAGGRLAGGAWFVVCGRGCWGQFAAADLALRRLNPTVALYWAAIRWAVERGCSFCDFGGIGHIPDPADGLWAFKKGFGPGDTRFAGEFDMVYRAPAYRAFRVAEEARWAWYGRRRAGG